MKKSAWQKLYGCAAVTLLSASIATTAQAQVPGAQTQQAFPGRVEEQVRLPADSLRTVPRVDVKEIKPQGAPPGAEKIAFKLDTLSIEGMGVYSESEASSVYGSYLGQKITLADLYDIAAKLTRKYRNDGYVLTQVIVPPQTIEGGTARLQVVEGYIDQVEVRGTDDENAMALIRRYAAQVKTGGRAVNIRELERGLLIINDLPGMSARGVLSPSKAMPGAADLLVVTERKPYDALIGIDNFGTRFLGPIQVTAAGSLNSMLGLNEKITAQFVTTPEHDLDNELYYFGLGYEQPIGTRGTQLVLSGSNTYTDPGFTLAPFDVEGRSQLLAAQVKHPFIRTRNMSLEGRIGFDARNVNSKNNVEPRREDRIRAARFGGKLEFLDTLFGAAFNVFDAQVSRGLDVLGATNDDDANVSRPLAEADFTKFNAEIQRLQRVSSEINLLMGVTGQWASNALYASEEFGVGGQSYGRGYDPSEIVGDDGLAGKLEVQWNEPYEFALFESYQLYGFYDAGKVWNTDATANNLKTSTVTSTGIGMRADFNAATQAGFMVALPLSKSVQTMGDQDARVFFNLSRKF